MLFDQCRVDVETEIQANWNETHVVYENEELKYADEYIRPAIIYGESNQVTLGPSGTHRRLGVLVIQIFVKENTGTRRIKFLADTLTPLFKSVKLGIIQFESPTLIRVGQNNGYYQENFQVPFYVDIC